MRKSKKRVFDALCRPRRLARILGHILSHRVTPSSRRRGSWRSSRSCSARCPSPGHQCGPGGDRPARSLGPLRSPRPRSRWGGAHGPLDPPGARPGALTPQDKGRLGLAGAPGEGQRPSDPAPRPQGRPVCARPRVWPGGQAMKCGLGTKPSKGRESCGCH